MACRSFSDERFSTIPVDNSVGKVGQTVRIARRYGDYDNLVKK